uniref:C-type lectin domain-containing protein n=1 Tax=Wuchereria bancrofti TaxID=6293 RepID=A0AAF5PUS9_WUCBA
MNNCSIAIFMICFTVALCAICNDGWRFSPHSRKCYKFFSKKITWTEAEFHCLIQNGHQLSIHNSRENRFVKEIARGASEVWLGSAKFGRTAQFEWSDKTPFNFKGWKNGQIPVSKLISPCTKMNVTSGEWFQSCCRIVAPYICQKDSQPNKSYASNTQKSYDTIRTNEKNSIINQQWRFLVRK